MIRIVLDTNVLLSALVFGGVPQKILEYCIDSSDTRIYFSTEIWIEINDKFLGDRVLKIAKKSKRNITTKEIEKFLEILYDNSTCINIKRKFEICRDSKDNMFLDVAFASNADYIITGDKDLLSLNSFQFTKIILPSKFLEIIK
jgi:uncharacterized protein